MSKKQKEAWKKRVKMVVVLAVMLSGTGVFGSGTAIMAMEKVQSKVAETFAELTAGADTSDETVLTGEQEKQLEEIQATYHVKNQTKIAKQLEEEKKKTEHTVNNMLIKYNPFGTNTQSAYVYFTTDKASRVSYTVSVSGSSIGDFTQDAYQKNGYQKEHEFQVIGLIPDMENKVTFTITDENGMVTTKTYAYKMGSLMGDEELILETEADKESAEELSDGLFVVLGNDDTAIDFMYYYDNAGVLRGEVPLLGYRSHRLLFGEDTMYYSISETKMVAVNRLGQVVSVFDLGDYSLHHDYVFDDDGNILILATDNRQDSVEDIVIKLDVKTGQVSECLDLSDLLGSYKSASVANSDGDLDWMHINTIQWMGEGQILLSSRETSTILKINNLYENPQIAYMLGASEFWAGTGYENLLFTKDGDFTIHGGQHTITYVADNTLKAGQYYLYMYNNNIGYSETNPDFKWSSIGLTENTAKGTEGAKSYYYKYLVDENSRTFKLADSMEVPYSGYVSSVQELDGNLVVDTGFQGVFEEYDKNHKLIARYKMNVEKFIYRVYKYQF